MSDSNQPFTEHLNRSKEPAATGRASWLTAALAVAAVVFLGLWFAGRHYQSDADTLRDGLNEAITNLANARSEIESNRAQITALKEQVAGLEQEKERASHLSKGLEEEMRSQLESKDVTISKLQGKLTVNILDRILFNSGEAVLQPDGEGVLAKIAQFLAQHPELKIHVVGHTDNVPIRAAARGRFASNWELSTARALAAVRFLTEGAGVDPRRVGAVGYGEFRPVADNSTAEGRALNRRIAITILPDELAGADTAPTVTPLSLTNPVTNAPTVVPPQPAPTAAPVD